VCLSLLAVASAAGATTVGQLFTPIDGCAANTIYLQTGVASGTGYTIPYDGVLTSWSYQVGNAAITGLKLKVASPASSGSRTIVGEATAGSQTPGAATSYPTRIPVKANDVIGIFFGGGGNCLTGTGISGDTMDYHTGDLSPGSSDTFSQLTGYKAPVSANLEPDADGDGYGDETQDSCPTDPTTHDACQADLSITKAADKVVAKAGDTITYTIGIKNNSAYNAAASVVVDDALPPNVKFVSAGGAIVCGPGVPGHVSCSMGDMAKGQSKTLTIVVKTGSAGTTGDTATVSSSTPDPNSSNNSASASTLVPLPPLVNLPKQSVTVGSNRIASVTFGCGSTAYLGCAGTLVDKTASKVLARVEAAKKKKILTVGSTTFTIQPGKTVKVRIKISKRALNLRKKTGKLKTIATSKSHDGLGQTVMKSAKVILKAKKKH
jgi:uncharacterized repeat protein (TIGR01451 family)